jgi:hypothetical protein
MPSDTRIPQVLDVLAASRQSFSSAVALAVDQVGAFLEARRAPTNGRAERTAHELGAFAAGRLDASRFASMFGETGTLDPLALARMERAYHALASIAERGSVGFVTRIPPGADLHTYVGRALAQIGRAFGAARAVHLARQGRYPSEEIDEYVGGFAFRRWNRAERQIAPPLVVEVDGGDLQAGGLAEYLDGRQKLVLVVHGAAPAAGLARLITPGVFVAQTTDPAELAGLAACDGPGIAALVCDNAARFVHTPGDAPAWERLTVHSVPEEEPRAALGSFTVFQQREEIALLRMLASPPSSAVPEEEQGSSGAEEQLLPAAVGPSAPPPLRSPAGGEGDEVDKLAAWLLSRTDLSGT